MVHIVVAYNLLWFPMVSPDIDNQFGNRHLQRSGVVRHQLVNDEPLGRSVDEAVRMLDALQYFEKNGKALNSVVNHASVAMVEARDTEKS